MFLSSVRVHLLLHCYYLQMEYSLTKNKNNYSTRSSWSMLVAALALGAVVNIWTSRPIFDKFLSSASAKLRLSNLNIAQSRGCAFDICLLNIDNNYAGFEHYGQIFLRCQWIKYNCVPQTDLLCERFTWAQLYHLTVKFNVNVILQPNFPSMSVRVLVSLL